MRYKQSHYKPKPPLHYMVTVDYGSTLPFKAYDQYSAEFLAMAATLTELENKMTFLGYRKTPK